MRIKSLAIGIIWVIFLSGDVVHSQGKIKILTRPGKQIELLHQTRNRVEYGQPLEIHVSATYSYEIDEMLLHFKSGDHTGFENRPIPPSTSSEYSTEISSDELALGQIEYFISATLSDGHVITIPEVDPAEYPIIVDVVDSSQRRTIAQNSSSRQTATSRSKSGQTIDVTILSPDPDLTVARTDFLFCASFASDGDIELSDIRLKLDGNDVTEQADISDYLILYSADKIDEGDRRMTIWLGMGEGRQKIAEQKFIAADLSKIKTQKSDVFGENPAKKASISGQIRTQYRHQKVSDHTLNVSSVEWKSRGEYGKFRYSGNILITSEQEKRMQRRNRYSFRLDYNRQAHLAVGDVYPRLNELMVWGRRVRGVHAGVSIGFVSLDLIHGELSRSIENFYTDAFTAVDTFWIADTSVTDTTNAFRFQENGRGAFQRRLWAARLSFGSSPRFQMGLNMMKIKDNVDSIDLQRTGEVAEFLGTNPHPKDNIAASLDLKVALDQRRIILSAVAAASLLNNDISRGIIDSVRADELGFNLESYVADDIKDYESWIVVNEYLNAIPFKFNDSGSLADRFVPKGIFAYKATLVANYFRNYLTLKYQWLGPQFKTLANNNVRRDIKGFVLSDRVRLLDNRVYLGVGIEKYENNVLGNQDAVTKTTSYRVNISYYPPKSLPIMGLSLSRYRQENGISRNNPELPESQWDQSVVNQTTDSAGDPVFIAPKDETSNQVALTLKKDVDFRQAIHTLALSFSNFNRNDETFRYGDSKNRSLSFILSSRFPGTPLRTTLKTTNYATESIDGHSEIKFTSVGMKAAYSFLDRKLRTYGEYRYSNNSGQRADIAIADQGTNNLYDDLYTVGGLSDIDHGAHRINLSVAYDVFVDHLIFFDINSVKRSGKSAERFVRLTYEYRF